MLSNDIILFIVVISLVVISVLMVYLVYNQNKPISINKDSSKEMKELKELSKVLENTPREVNKDLTAYEEEQEQKAIISYDELINSRNNVSIGYESKELVNDVEIKKVDLSKTGEIELDPIKQRLNSKVTLVSYEHEEEFLNSLKNLQYLLNK